MPSIYDVPDRPDIDPQWHPLADHDQRAERNEALQDDLRDDAANYHGSLIDDCAAISHMKPRMIQASRDVLGEQLKQIAADAVSASRFDRDFRRIFGDGKC